jgi:hypothetical protein
LPGGSAGTAYSQTVDEAGGTPPFAWSISYGSTAERTEPRRQHRYDQRHAGGRRNLVFLGATQRRCGCNHLLPFSEH